MKIWIKRFLSRSAGLLCRSKGARIVYFHSVHPTHPLAHRPELFRAMSDIIAQSGKNIVTVSKLGQHLREGKDIRNCIAITFDDGYADNAEIALPILIERGLSATCFVATGFISEVKNTPYDPERKYRLYSDLPIMSKSQIYELSRAGIEIGSHADTHCYLKNKKSEIVRKELRDSKAKLEDMINKPVVSFCFPNGEIPNNARQILQEEGYLQAVTTRWGCVHDQSDPYFLPRQIMDYYDNLSDFKAKLSGKHDYLRYYQAIWPYNRK